MDKNKRAVVAWWLYDCANSAFVLTVVTAFFPVLFKSFWCTGVDATVSTARLGAGNAVAGLVVALLSPLLGAIADRGGIKKRLLGCFVCMGAVATVTLFLVPKGEWIAALLLFLVASVGFNGGNVFYDALLIDVAEKRRMDWVSSVGFAVGYLGSGLLFVFNVIMVNNPARFGCADTAAAVKIAFVIAAVWWMIFSIPLFLFVKERRNSENGGGGAIGEPVQRVLRAAGLIIRNRPMLLFLCAYWLYIDGVHTFVLMAVDFGMSIGLAAPSLMIALIVVQFVAFPSSLAFGKLAERFGAVPMIVAGIVMYIGVCCGGSFLLHTATDYIVLAAITGVAQGGIQALSRSAFGKMVPAAEAAEYFGFFNIVNRFAVIGGPLLVGGVALFSRHAGIASTTASRIGMASVALLFIAGAVLLLTANRMMERRTDDR